MNETTIWTGTADVDGIDTPMRVTQDDDGRLMAEFQFPETEPRWEADSGIRFRDMQPRPGEELKQRMIAANLLDA